MYVLILSQELGGENNCNCQTAQVQMGSLVCNLNSCIPKYTNWGFLEINQSRVLFNLLKLCHDYYMRIASAMCYMCYVLKQYDSIKQSLLFSYIVGSLYF